MLAACGPNGKHAQPPTVGPKVPPPGVEIHAPSGRPRLVVVRRDGDPSAAIAVELESREGDALRLAVVSAMIGARLEKSGFGSVEVFPGARIARVRALAPQLGGKVAEQIDAALTKPASEDELASVRAAVDAFAARPAADPALAPAARCLDRPTRPASYKAPAPGELLALAETMRKAQAHADTITVGAVGSGATEGFVQAWRALSPLPGSVHAIAAPSEPKPPSITLAQAHEGAIVVVEGAPRAAIPAALRALSDLDGALAARLRAADDWRLRGVAGAARAEGGCIVVEVEPSPVARIATKDGNVDKLAARASVALEVARQEIELALESSKAKDESETARLAIGEGGDPREAADRAAWWAWPASPSAKIASSVTLEVPATAVAKGPQVDVEATMITLQPKFAQALGRARLAWTKSEIELRGRVEAGQGELWAALASPCSVAHEGIADAGLAAIAARALVAAHVTRASNGVIVEPWTATTGVGLVAHAAPRTGESSAELAHRVGDALGRLFLASFPSLDDLAVARADALAKLGPLPPPSDLLRAALRASSPLRPSWLEPLGTLDAAAKVGLEAIDLRLATLRAGPLRIAVLGNAEDAQLEASARAAERWVPRRPGEARACPVVDAGAPPKGAIHALTVKTGTGVALAYPVDESQREGATALAAVLDGDGGRLAAELGAGLATGYQARLVRGLARHALVVVALAPEGNVDAVVQKLRALLDRLRGGGLEAADLARADRERGNARMLRRLDPRARLVDLFAGESSGATIDLAQLRAVAAKVLEEDRAQVVVARLGK